MEFLINLTIKSTFILLLSGSTLWLLKNASATLRHWIISLTMIGLLGLPILLGLLPTITITIPYLPENKQATTAIATKIKALPKEIIRLDKEKPHLEMPAIPIGERYAYKENDFESADNQYLEPIGEAIKIRQFSIVSMTDLWVVIWLLGFLFFIVKVFMGRYLIYKITIKSTRFYLPESLQDYVVKFTEKQVLLLESKAIKTPMTWGGIHPVILLPKEAKLWSETELRTVLIHELNHIKRNDYWLHLLGLFATCLYWYNPLVWLMKKQQLLEREKACDEAVLNTGIPQQNYAQQLIDIARELSGKSPILKEHALPMAKIPQTKARVLAILQFDQRKFNFSKWKQRNWGLFYACLFPMLAAFTPVGKVMQAHFDLPKLDSVDHFLATNSLVDLIIPATTLKTSENGLYEPSLATANQVMTVEHTETIRPSNQLEMLEKGYDLLGITPAIEQIKIPQRPQKTGLYGKWKAGKSEFTIWTYGEFKIIPTPPYIEVVDTSGIVFIEEYIPGFFRDKVNQLTIGKAPVDGRMGVGYKGKLSALIPKGTPIKVWSDNTDYEEWMATKGKDLPKYLLKKQKEQAIIAVTAEDKEWKKRIEGSKKWLNGFFVPEENSLKQVKIEDRRLVLDLGKVPYKQLDLPQGNLVKEKIGRTVLPENGNGGTIGNLSTNPKGIKYITVLKGDNTPALVKDFNFHLAENDFKNVKFSLQLYNIVNGEIGYAITQQPIPLTLADDQKGWIKMDLSAFNIVTKGNVLVVLTNNGFSGTKRRKKLYFSLAKDHQDYQPLLVDNNWKTKNWEKAFIMYLGIGRVPDKKGTIEKKEEKGYLIDWQRGKSQYKVWTYGDFKTYSTTPYIEVLNPNSMVIVEETRKTILGTKKFRLVITKAPNNGDLVHTFLNGKPNSSRFGIQENDPLHLWFVDGKWDFFEDGKNKWINEKLITIFWDLGRLTTGSTNYQSMKRTDEEWWNTIQHHFKFRKDRFIKKTSISKEIGKKNSTNNDFAASDLSNNSVALTADKIIETAINRLRENYIQKPHTADLYYRYSSLSSSDSLAYQSEAVLKYYDAEGYQKRGWRKAASSRYAQLEQARITTGEPDKAMKLEELGRLFIFWSHEPIITNDKPLSERSRKAYDFKLVGTKEFMGKSVYEISFVCTKLKDRFAGLPSLKYMKGKIYVNQEDYAILRYEQNDLMDYEWTGKHPEKRGHLKERNIIESSSVEIFSKNAAGYYLDYAKKVEKVENQHTHLDGKKEIIKGIFTEEYQYSNVRIENIEPLKENLFNINKETKYSPDYWKKFNNSLNKQL